ncbi:MAG: hypothetical protein ACI9UU_000607 [Candidatus Azotimanducaceae bacterium]|jgi:hypothetical protein
MILRVVLAVFLWCLVSTLQAEQHGGAVAASFSSSMNAEKTVAELQEKLASSRIGVANVSIHDVIVDGRAWFRVVVSGEAGGRALVSELQRIGYAGAWFWASADKPKKVAIPTHSSLPATIAIVPTESQVNDFPEALPIATTSIDSPLTPIDVLGGVVRHRYQVPSYREADIAMSVDGQLDESTWAEVPYHDEFVVAVPNKGTPGEYDTHLRVFATEKGLYVGARLFQPPETMVSRLSVRDDFLDRDTFGMNLDASGEGLVGYWFILALSGNVQDGKILRERNYSRDWDGAWLGKSAQHDDSWTAEMFLPWSMMNMPEVEGPRTIGFLATRQVSHKNERYQWPGHPYSSARFLSAFNEIEMEGVQPVPLMAAIPYASVTWDEAAGEQETRIGADISWKPSPKLEGTLSLNPDFGAVEADDVVLNLTASETFFPEKRLFFLEGNEVFEAHPRSGIGYISRIISNEDFASTSRRVFARDFLPTPISLLNTRRIGGTARQVSLDADVTPERGQRDLPTDLLGAVKLTGSVGDTRYGVMAAFEDDVEWRGNHASLGPVNIDDEGRDFAVARFLYEDIDDDHRAVGYLGTAMQGPLFDSYVHSIDAHYTSGSGKVKADLQTVMSRRDGVDGYGGLFDVMYAVSSNWRHKFEIEYMDETVNFNDLGFLRRNDYASARYIGLYNKQNLTEKIKNYRTTISLEQQYSVVKGYSVDNGVYWRNSMVFPGRNTVKANFAYLPKRWEDFDSRGNGAYRVEERGYVDVLLSTSAARKVALSTSVGVQQEHLGDWTTNASLGVTIRPSSQFAIDFEVRYQRRNGWLVYQGDRNFGRYDAISWQPSLDFNWFITYNHQIRLSMQWAGVKARENGFYGIPLGDGDLVPTTRTRADHDFTLSLLTAQLRYRWEIAPLTDFFLVYNRGNALPDQTRSPFDDLFDDVLRDPIIDSVVAKVRWRFSK